MTDQTVVRESADNLLSASTRHPRHLLGIYRFNSRGTHTLEY